MPTIRYRIRNEYGLGGSELYGAADKDDPKALLEGVAAAGLVGLLRQLGDLAEYVSSCYFPCILVLRPGIVDWTMSFAPCSFLWVVFPYRFAAEIFHNLYEEVINTASRGHKLFLQVQQLETDLKSIGFSSESASSCLSYRQG
ncbi:hypothetical protein BHE74_00028223 [Ensete ventricosum]|nr:hypothetical protein GW17_00015760 [Ensete ventricosum]RWW64524.1 hypothetical protein BHE74_00028223 [Ensete ventricosum]